jgi:hypothetical protein
MPHRVLDGIDGKPLAEARVRRGAHSRAHGFMVRKPDECVSRSVDIPGRHKDAFDPIADDLAATDHVGPDNRTAGSGGFQERARHALAIGGQEQRNVMGPPNFGHVGGMAAPSNTGDDDHFSNTSADMDNGFDGSGLPNTSSSIAAPIARARCAAAKASAIPFGRIILATTATFNGGAGGSGAAGKAAGSTPAPPTIVTLGESGSRPSSGGSSGFSNK